MVDETEDGQATPEEESDGGWTMWDALGEALVNKDFLAAAQEAIEKLAGAQKERTAIERERLQFDRERFTAWRYVTLTFLWQRFALSVLALIGLAAGAWWKLLSAEVIGVLITGVIASLFVQPRKE
jgi:hypothetical protein